MAGVVVVVAALLGAVLPAPTPPHPRRDRTFGFVSFAVFIALLAALGPGVLRSDTQSFVDRLARAMDTDDDAAFEATLRRGLYLHPGEPALALLAGAYAGSKRHPDAARWLLVAMEEAPDWAAPHVVAAQWLFTEGRTDQALLEIREAEERRPGTARTELCALLTRFPLMEHLERAAPIEGERVGFLDRTVASCPALPAELRQQIDSAILKEDPTRAAAALREAQRLIGEERVDEAMELLDGSLENNPDDVRLWISLVGANLKAGDDERTFALLKEARSRGLDSIALDETKARVEAAFGYIDQMRATLIHVRGQSRGDARMIARSFMLEGELEASLGNVDEALAAYEAADLANPASAALQVAASLALRLGRPTYARRAYEKLCTRQPEGPWCLQEAGLSKELRKGPVEPLNP